MRRKRLKNLLRKPCPYCCGKLREERYLDGYGIVCSKCGFGWWMTTTATDWHLFVSGKYVYDKNGRLVLYRDSHKNEQEA